MIKLAIAGIHGSGKTTLIYNIKNYLESINKNVCLLPESARLCPYPISEKATVEAQQWIWDDHLNRETQIGFTNYLKNYDIVLCDRTLLDNLLYYKYLLKGQDDPMFNKYWNYTKRWMSTYDYISVLDMNPEFIVDDGLRMTDINKTIEINNLFIKYLKPHMNININRFNYKKKIGEII